jgi:hypothetical protein
MDKTAARYAHFIHRMGSRPHDLIEAHMLRYTTRQSVQLSCKTPTQAAAAQARN